LDDYSDDGSYQPSESSDDDDDAISNNDDDYTSNEPDEVDDDDDEDDSDDDSADIDADAPASEESDSSDSVSSDDESVENPGVGNDDESVENTGVENNDATSDDDGESVKNTGVGDDEIPVENTGVHQPTEYERFRQAEEAGRTAALNNDNKPRTRSTAAQEFIHSMFEDMDPSSIFELMSGEDEEEMLSFVTAQMTAKAGLKYFGQDGADAIMVELEQLLYRKVMDGCKAGDLSKEQKKAALKYLMFLKQKRCGKIKGRGCADGRKQRLYKTKEESSSPTVSIEALFLTCMIDAMEDRYVVTCDIPGAFMHADIDELIHIKLEGELVDLLIRLDATYKEFVTVEYGKRVIYTKLNKALYGTMQASLLFWRKFKKFLTDLGYEENPYDSCVVNKMINGKQCTVCWYVDDVKASHVEESVVEDLISKMQEEYGKEAPLTVSRGKVLEYLGMKIDYSNTGKVVFSRRDYVKNLLEECPDELLKAGTATTPAANHISNINPNATKLDKEKAEIFHHLVAKLLYLSKRTRPDIQFPVTFLTTRVREPDIDDWKKLGRCLCYLRGSMELDLTLETALPMIIRWWIDSAYGVHVDCKSHTGGAMSLGKGCPLNMSRKQRINTRSSTEAELVGVNDNMTMVLWTKLFLEAQGLEVMDNIIYQDNKSTMLLEKNGRQSSGKKTRHFDIRYYFIHDHIKRGTVRVEYCPTDLMVGDFHTKPLQGSAFHRFRARISLMIHFLIP
jgi:Reverse transcriptase (RNA-dependent DNA polymerase)